MTATLDPVMIPPPSKIAQRWVKRRSFSKDRLPPLAMLQASKRAEGSRISVGILTFDDASTVGRMCSEIRRELMEETSFVDELVVLDRGSADASVTRAREAGASVLAPHELMPEIPPSPGKGDSLWRALSALSGEIVVWLDADMQNFSADVVTRLVAPLLTDPSISFVKGYFEPPSDIDVEIDDVVYIADGGRLTELSVRPLLNIFFPELGGFFQPLGGENAARRDVLRRIPFVSGCSADVAILIDLLEDLGLDAMAQVDLGQRVARTLPLDELGPRAHAIARTILSRAQERKRIKLSPNAQVHPLLLPHDRDVDVVRLDEVERPPLDLVPSYLAALRGNVEGEKARLVSSLHGSGRQRRAEASRWS